jgi:anti-sigma factor RsiW
LNCQNVIRELSNYIDGDLDAAAIQELERHLASCRECRLVVDQTKKTIELFCNSEPVSLPAELHAKLHAALRAKMDQKSS